MVIVKNPSKITSQLIGKQPVEEGIRYRSLRYVDVMEIDGDTVACNGITRCIARITEEEAKMLSSGVDNPKGAEELIEKWFLVPDNHNDYQMCIEARELIKTFSPVTKNRHYTVMTTLDCNARCFYCYQMGRNKNRIPMSEETANAVADYMIKNSIGGKVNIQWYGGEPLYNESVIDIISNRLREAQIKYKSTMITNAYLLSEDVLNKAVALWNLEKIQVALDGTEDVYNSVKAYIHKDVESPFKVVMENIKNTLERGIRVVIRVNFDQHNKEDIFALANELKKNFGLYNNFAIYSDILYENAGTKSPTRMADERMQLVDNMLDFENYCMEIGLRVPRAIKENIRTHRCMADNKNAIVISPDGKVGKCDHKMETLTHTSVFTDEVDTEMLNEFKNELNCKEWCENCPVFHNCIRLKNCPDDGDPICDDAYKKKKHFCYLVSVKNEYRKLLRKNGDK